MGRIGYLKPWKYEKYLCAYFSPLCVFCKKGKAQLWSVCILCWQRLFDNLSEHNQNGVYSLFSYEGFFKDLLLDFKGRHNYFLHVPLARFLWQALPDKPICVVVLAPCSQSRRKAEGIDPVSLIGRDLSTWGIKVCSPFYKKGLSQKFLSKKQRKINIANSLFLNSKEDLRQLEGKSIVLVDDVTTTGSTLMEMEERFKGVGISKVTKLVLARVPHLSLNELG